MIFQLNGKVVKIPEIIDSVEKLLTHYHLQDRIVVVEINKEIVMKEDYGSKKLSNGDKVEIIHFVGGG